MLDKAIKSKHIFRQILGCKHNFAAVNEIQKRHNGSWLGKILTFDDICSELKNLYTKKLVPLESKYLFHEFHSPLLYDQDFDSKPMIILIGQYSTGKTTFLKYLLGQEFPGLRIGPEPTTDRFIIIMKDQNEGVIPGNALVTDSTRPFRALNRFGNSFLTKIQCSLINSPVLNSLILVDTPGILAGEKQRLDRGYDFDQVLGWFSERADRILLLFDANKLDISDEFRLTIQAIKRYDDKICVLLNKADAIDTQSLMRVYGALMWSLGKVFNTPEVVRVFVGSFWDNPLVYEGNRKLFHDEEQDLLKDLQSLPKHSILRKINDLNKRARLAVVHAHIIGEIVQRMPSFFKSELIKNDIVGQLDDIYNTLAKDYSLSPGDFPDIGKMKEKLEKIDYKALFPRNISLIKRATEMMNHDIPRLMTSIPEHNKSNIDGGAFITLNMLNRAKQQYPPSDSWFLEGSLNEYKETFLSLKPINGKLNKDVASRALEETRLPNSVLIRIWYMSDIDCDGQLDEEEFAVAMHLSEIKKNGEDLPEILPLHLVPPSKRHLVSSK